MSDGDGRASPRPRPPVGPPGPPRRGETWRERLAYWQVAVVQWLGILLPGRVGRRLFDLLGAAAFHLARGTRATVEANLARVVGEPPGSPRLEAAAKEAFRSYARYWFDAFHARVMSREEVDRRFRVEGREHIDRAVEEGRGAVLALPHMGNWDVGGRWLRVQGYQMAAVAERLRPPRLYDLFVRHRRALGITVVPLQETRKLREDLTRRLGENHLVALVADRDLRGKGVPVEMFGAPRRLPTGPALLARLTGSPLLPCAMYESPEGWNCLIGPPLDIPRTDDVRADVAEATRRLAVEFERAIAAAPTEWHMFQPAWPEGGPAVPARRDARAAGEAGA